MEQRLFDRIEKSNNCWLWTGNKWANGYGKVQGPKKLNGNPERYAHRAVWMFFNGDIPNGKYVLHHCDIRDCVNPAHLYIGDQFANMRDASIRKRIRHGIKHTWTRLSPHTISKIKSATGTYRKIGELFGITAGYAWKIKNGTRRKHG